MAVIFAIPVLLLAALHRGCLGAIPVEVHPREVIRLPNQNVTFLCRVGVPLQYCRVEIPSLQPFNLNAHSAKGGIYYYGDGLNNGHCGVTVENVREEFNGQVKCYLGISTEATESSGTMQLTVARAPKVPELSLSRGIDNLMVYKLNDVLQATCTVRDGRPVANISWYLDDEQIYGDELGMPTVVNIAKENLFTRTQNLTRVLRASDNERELRCVADHPAYPQGRAVASKQLDVKYPPLPQAKPIDLFDYRIGSAGTITVIVEANPMPQFEWIVRDQRIKVEGEDSTGRIRAHPIEKMGKGKYAANLEIADITKQDTETQYILRTYNALGSQEYIVQISTNPEPEGLELGAGAIIGIVAAILIVLLVVFLVIFARITGRWCFSGSQQKRNLAESSDTESADVRPKGDRRIISPIKLTSFFKRNKSMDETEINADNERPDEVKIPLDESQIKKQPEAAAAAAAQPSTTPKEGIVYAELDLVSQNLKPVVKNGDDKTEYAEIVYTPKEGDSEGGKEAGKGT